MPAPPLLTRPGYADLIRNTPGLVAYWRLRDSSGTVMRNELTTAGATMTATPTLLQGTPMQDGAGIKFNGTTQALSSAVDLSAYAQVSVSFWLWWDTFGNGDNLAMEYTASLSAAAGFYVDPNGFSGAFHFGIGKGDTNVWIDKFTRPTAAVWHHYLFTMNRATPVNVAYVDGTIPVLTTHAHNAGTYGNYANSTLNFMSRNHASLFGAGRLSEVALFGGVLLTANDARNQYQAGLT